MGEGQPPNRAGEGASRGERTENAPGGRAILREYGEELGFERN